APKPCRASRIATMWWRTISPPEPVAGRQRARRRRGRRPPGPSGWSGLPTSPAAASAAPADRRRTEGDERKTCTLPVSPSPAPPPLSPALAPFVTHFAALAADYDVVLSDVWGVVHNGVAAAAEACDALARFRAGGSTVVLITNAPRPGAVVARST